jgi:hypothetical protein
MFDLPDPDSTQTVADWVELEIAAGELSISRSKLISVTGNDESFVSGVWRELEQRHVRYANPAFAVDSETVTKTNAAVIPEYVACLLYSLYGVSEEHRTDPKLFERMTAEAVKNYLHGEVFIFGWPVMDGQDANIGLRVKAVASAARERFVERPAGRYKDRGVDIVAWKPFNDHRQKEHRSSQLVILSQCAAGADWRGKTGQLPYNSWKRYIHWACNPITSFAVPRVIPEDLWHDISEEAGILFDRIRLINLLPNGVSDAELRTALQTWVAEEIEDAKVR